MQSALRFLEEASTWTKIQYWRGWAFYFIALLSIVVLTSDVPVKNWLLSLQISAQSLGYGDPNSFATAAFEIERYGWITEASQWIFNLWPPGFVLLEAGLLKVFGVNAPMPLLLLLLSAGLFAAIMQEMQRTLADSFGRWAWFAPLMLFFFTESRTSLLSPIGLLFGEWLAIGCFCWATLLLMRGTLRAQILAGLLFALSAYSRSQFELFLDSILLVSFILFIVVHYFARLGGPNTSQPARVLLVAMIVAQLLMFPWRLYHMHEGHGLRWVSTAGVMIQNGLTSDATLMERGGAFVILGGGNIACHLAPDHCGQTDPSTMARTYLNIFLKHPVEWVDEKAQLLPRYWFVSPRGGLTSPSLNPSVFDSVLNGVQLICLFLFGALLWGSRKTHVPFLWGGVGLGLLMAYSAIIVFAHLEVRYFFFAKIFSVFSFILLLGVVMGIRKNNPNNMRSNRRGTGWEVVK